MKIDSDVFSDVQKHLAEIEKEHNVVILQAIESGSRAWGFPSPDSDYDVRFIYAHPRDWYLQLAEERDVIELPINDELDIAGWDLRKAFNLANKGNAVIQEWMISPIVYKQSGDYGQFYKLLSKAFNPISAYHHYRSMAKKAFYDIEQSKKKKLKRFFYFARATLSAKWILEKQTMPSIVFADLVGELVSDQAIAKEVDGLVSQKAKESEQSLMEVPASVYGAFTNMFETLDEGASLNYRDAAMISNDQFRIFLNSFDGQSVKRVRIFLGCTIFGLAFAFIGLYFVGGILVSPKTASVGSPPKDLPIEIVRIPKGDSSLVHGWFLQGRPDRAGVLLLHGVRADRREMLDRARFLFSAGYSVLLIDMQAHGETSGEHITFGFLEALDARVSVEYLRGRVNGRKIGVIGSSMGGAAALLGDQPVTADAVILEGVFATLTQAIENRIVNRLGGFGKVLSPLLSSQFEPRLGIPLESVSPVNAISKLRSPVLIISGAEDRHARPSEAQAIYDAANQPKSLWFIDGAQHQDLHRYNEEDYERKILTFFSQHLK